MADPATLQRSDGMKQKYGFVQRASPEQMAAAEKAKATDLGPPAEETLHIGRHIKAAFDRNRRFKQDIEQRLLACLRARRGMYSDAQLAEIQQAGGSANPVYVRLTTVKCRAAVSWLKDIFLQPGDWPFGFDNTPVPDLPDEVKEFLRRKAQQELMAQMQATGVVPTQEEMVEYMRQLRERVQRALEERAKVAAKRMEKRVADHMAEGEWEEALTEFINDFSTYPTAFMKGPFLMQKKALKWASGWIPEVVKEPRLHWKRVSPFDAYPAPYARSCQEGDFIERVRLTRKEMLSCIGLPGYNAEEIRKAVLAYASGRAESWLPNESERNRLEHSRTASQTDTGHLIDGLHFWGSVPGYMLIEWGMDPDLIDDPLEEYEVDAIQVGAYTIRVAINDDPLGERPYDHASFEEVPGSIWGSAIPELMEDNARICNATVRSMCDNMSFTSGPMMEVETDRLPDDFELTEVTPRMVLQTKSDPNAGGRRAVAFHNVDSNAPELMGVFEKFDQKSDDVTNIPRYSYGNEKVGGAGRTLGGLDMLMSAAAKGVRNAVMNIDMRVIKRTVHRTFIHEMLYGDDQAAKGDCKVVARGASALLIKDQARLRRQEFLQTTNNPVDLAIVGKLGRAQVLRETCKALDMPADIIPPDEVLMARWTAEAQAALEQQQAQPAPQGKKREGAQQAAA